MSLWSFLLTTTLHDFAGASTGALVEHDLAGALVEHDFAGWLGKTFPTLLAAGPVEGCVVLHDLAGSSFFFLPNRLSNIPKGITSFRGADVSGSTF